MLAPRREMVVSDDGAFISMLYVTALELFPGPATSARFSAPYGLSSDGMGGYVIADSSASIVRRIFSNGTIVTIAASERLWDCGGCRFCTPTATLALSS